MISKKIVNPYLLAVKPFTLILAPKDKGFHDK